MAYSYAARIVRLAAKRDELLTLMMQQEPGGRIWTHLDQRVMALEGTIRSLERLDVARTAAAGRHPAPAPAAPAAKRPTEPIETSSPVGVHTPARVHYAGASLPMPASAVSYR